MMEPFGIYVSNHPWPTILKPVYFFGGIWFPAGTLETNAILLYYCRVIC